MRRKHCCSPPEAAELRTEYVFRRELGRGGTAVVFLADDRESGAKVAIKLIQSPLMGDAETQQRFMIEARTAALLQHPNIVGLHAVKRLRNGMLAMVMQYVAGGTLKQLIQRRAPLPCFVVERVLRDIALALDHAHGQGIVHRDVKPENIFLDVGTQTALLADFGIARTSETAAAHPDIAVGTPAYMAPEQIDCGSIDGRADLYSLGMVGWEMLTGEAPWEGETLYSILHHQKHSVLPAIEQFRSDVPLHLRHAIEILTRKQCAERFADAASLVALLDQHRARWPWMRWLAKWRLRRATTSSPRTETRSTVLTPPPALPESRPPSGSPRAETVDENVTVRFPRQMPSPDHRVAASEPNVLGAADEDASMSMEVAASVVAAVYDPPADTSVDRQRSWFAVPRPFARASRITSPTQLAIPLAFLSLVVLLAAGLGASVPGLAGAWQDGPAIAPTAGAGGTSAPAAGEADAGGTERHWWSGRRGPAVTAPDAGSVGGGSLGRPLAAAAEKIPAIGGRGTTSAEPAGLAGRAEVHESGAIGTARVRAIAAGGVHSCLLTMDGEALCWGANSTGQLGDGGTARALGPTPVAGGFRFRTITTGPTHTCGITTDHDVACWGSNESGQLGDGTRNGSVVPLRIEDRRRFSAVETGRAHTCGLSRSGEVFCWGANDEGQLGDAGRRAAGGPVLVRRGGFSSLSVGWNHGCALDRRGRPFCWGSNSDGQLGRPRGEVVNGLHDVGGGQAFTQIVAGDAHTCAIARGGNLLCWGRNTHGQLGDGSTLTRSQPAAVTVPPARVRFASLTAGSGHTCGLSVDGSAFCWGWNAYGQLGDGTRTDRSRPAPVLGGLRFAELKATGAHTCGVTRDGQQFCWGYNLDGQLGDGTRDHQSRPTRVAFLTT